MQIYSKIEKLNKPKNKSLAIALGFFDGLHIGHRDVIKNAVDWANENNASSAVFSFNLPKDSALKGARLMQTSEKLAQISALGVEHYIAPNFEDIKNLTAENFVKHLVETLDVKAIFCGENFRFGAKASGDVEFLRNFCAQKNVQVFEIPLKQYAGETVSASRIRLALENGDVEKVNAMLGAVYEISFPVQKGEGLGTKLAVPTINQHYPKGYQMPKYGIYITKTKIGEDWYPSATGLGTRPTVNSDETIVTCETFITNFDGNLYGKKPTVAFYKYLSESKKFNSLQELKACIESAAQAAKDFFK